MLRVILEPQGEVLEMKKVRTVRKLLSELGETVNSVLVIRDGVLLTEDIFLHHGESVTVRSVRSKG